MNDLIVIGAGLTGLIAAHTAATAGLKVGVVAKGMGSLHWAAGTVDLLGYLPHSSDQPVQQPLEELSRLGDEHPYHLVDSDLIAQSLEAFRQTLVAAGLDYVGAPVGSRNLQLPSAVGAVRPTFLAPQAQAAGDLRRSEPLLIVGIQGLRDFYPQLIADNLTAQGYRARAAFLPLDLFTQRRDYTPVLLAEAMDDAGRTVQVAQALSKLAAPGERIGLPAILGMHEHLRTLRTLQERAGAAIFEIPTLPPSIPGIRLFHALRRTLAAQGVRIEVGMEVIGFGSRGRTIEWVESATSARPLKHRAAHFLLASGGILGGGFSSDHKGRCWETIFNLPLTTPQDRAAWFRPDFLDPGGHPVFREGVAVDRNFQPVDAGGRVLFDNLQAGGTLLAGSDPIGERSMEGLAIITGRAAALAITNSQPIAG